MHSASYFLMVHVDRIVHVHVPYDNPYFPLLHCRSSLHLASQGGHHQLVGMLVDRGADRDLVTPLDGNR